MSFSIRSRIGLSIFILSGILFGVSEPSAHALDMDWSGQFRAESHWIHAYGFDTSGGASTVDPTRAAAGGYYVPPGGSREAFMQPLFLRLKPRLIVNDNIYIKSEWWVGSPIYGLFGSAFPRGFDQRQFYSSQSRGAQISAQRLWGEFVTDIGTAQVGRAPLHWGLGLFWNAGDGLWDRYMSTGDMVRLVSKFGSFSLAPAYVKYSSGNNIGGACNVGAGSCVPSDSYGDVVDLSLMFKYDNPDEDLEGGVNFVRRLAGAQDPASGILGINGQASRLGYNVWDIYGKKKLGPVTIGLEVPIATGRIGTTSYNAFAGALETNWKITEHWDTWLRAGRAPGQPSTTNGTVDKFRAFYFHPNYKLALIMFNYQTANFAGPNTQNNPSVGEEDLASPFDNPIVNANYGSLGGGFHIQKWDFRGSFSIAHAAEAAAAQGFFYNTWQRRFVLNNTGKAQSKFLGWEMDYGSTFRWDENFELNFDFGWFFPGDYYAFSNTTLENPTSPAFAAVLRAGVNF